jgi:hypothetical protein
MALNSHATYPHTHSYVIKLRHDAAPERGLIVGRLQHIYSGQQCDFSTADELIACLIRGAALTAAAQREAALEAGDLAGTAR